MVLLNLAEPRRVICGAEGLKLWLKRAPIANFMAFSLVLRFCAVTLRTFSLVLYVVVGPLGHCRERSGVAKESYIIFLCGGAPRSGKSGRAKAWKTRAFDDTMGFPGEDVAQHPQR